MDLFMFMGQSNMAGRGITSEKAPEPAPVIAEGAGYEYRAITAPDRLCRIEEPFGRDENVVDGINDITADGRLMKTGSMVTAFVNSYYAECGEPVLAVSAAKGGSSIAQWQPDAPDGFLPDAVYRLNRAKAYAARNGIAIRHIYMVWCQGETDGDVNTSKEDFFARCRKTFDVMKDNGVEHIFNVLIGKCNIPGSYDRYDHIIAWEKEFADLYDDVSVVSEGFETMWARGLMKDEYHYFQQAYNEVGTEAGRAAAVIGGGLK